MTCQVILGNGHGLAIASQSTAQKIYPLRLPHRIAVMHVGAGLFHDAPYGVLIDEWIQSLGDVQLRHVGAYVNSFVDWLSDNLDRISLAKDRDADALLDTRERIEDLSKRIKSHLEAVSPEHHVWATTQFLRGEIASIRGRESLDGYGAPEVTAAMNYLWSFGGDFSISASIDHWFDAIPRNEEIDRLATDYVHAVLEKVAAPSGISAITFVGFGSEELYGAMEVLNVSGTLRGSICRFKWGAASVMRNYPRQMFEFLGQAEAIEDFLYGYSYSLLENVGSKIIPPTDSTSDVGLDHAGDMSQLPTLSGQLMREAELESRETRMGVFAQTISVLPVLSLAETARRLVGIQSLELMIRGEVESVGKQLQTAVITRSDGFKFIDRSR